MCNSVYVQSSNNTSWKDKSKWTICNLIRTSWPMKSNSMSNLSLMMGNSRFFWLCQIGSCFAIENQFHCFVRKKLFVVIASNPINIFINVLCWQTKLVLLFYIDNLLVRHRQHNTTSAYGLGKLSIYILRLDWISSDLVTTSKEDDDFSLISLLNMKVMSVSFCGLIHQLIGSVIVILNFTLHIISVAAWKLS